MKKFVLAALFVTSFISLVSAQYSTAITATVSTAGPFGSLTANLNQSIRVPLLFANTASIGLLVAGAQTRAQILATVGGNNATTSVSQSWNVVVAQFNGKWYEFDRSSNRSQLTLDQYSLTSFTPTAQSTEISNAEVPLTSSANMNVSIRSVTAVAGNKALYSSQVSLDPTQADNQMVYLMSSDYTQGVQLTFSGIYDFETSNGYQGSDTTKAFYNYDLPTIRTSLAYWAIFGPVNASSDSGTVAHLNATLVQKLAASPNNSLLAQVLSVLSTELQVSTPPGSGLQTWAFPTTRMYRSLSQNTPDYSDAFFVILEEKGVISSPTDSLGTSALNQPLGQQLAARALDYLKAAASSYPEASNAFNESLAAANSQGNWVPTYNPSDPINLSLSSQDLLQVTPTVGIPASTITMTIPSQSPTASAPIVPTFQSPILFFPPGPNLLTADTLSNYSAVQPLELPVSATGSYQGMTNSIELDFTSPQAVETLLFWFGQNTSISSVTASLGGVPVTLPNGLLTYATAVPVPNIVAMSQIAVQNVRSTLYGLALNDWGQPFQVDKIVVTFSGGPVLNLRAYSQKTSFDPTLIYTAAAQFIAVVTKATTQPPELFSATSGNDAPYFLQQSGSSMPRGGSQPPQNYQPIWYAAGGLDTPLSFNFKALNNQFWKKEFHVASALPFTEFDLAKKENQPISVDSSFLYRSGSSASTMPAPGPIVAPASLPVPLSANATSWGRFVYPYTYGFVPSTASGAVTNPNSPVYVEKMAGVDGPGMLVSLIKLLGWSTRATPDVQQRYDARVNLSTYAQVQSGAPWQSYSSTTGYFSSTQWFLENSYVLTNWMDAQAGDILVGYEGSELTVAIVVSVDVNDTDPMHRLSVVTISRATQRALYARWSTMSLNPNGYHLRRLVIQQPASDEGDQTPPVNTGFLQFPSGFFVTYALNRPDPDNFKQWIPNTGELAYLGKIQPAVAGIPQAGALLDGAVWSIGPNWAQSYTVGNPNAPQALSAKAETTVFYLVALKAPHSEDGVSILLTQPVNFGPEGGATDNYWVDPSLTNGRYVVVYKLTPAAGGAFSVELNPNLIGAGWTQTLTDGNLALIDPSHFAYEDFAVVATTNGGAAVAGDDIQIGFVLQTKNGAVTIAPSSAPRLAAYDKKMLWRANLYVDEGAGQKDGTGNYKDWNDRHPWVGTSVDINEWNIPDPGYSGVPGGQIIKIRPWTRYYLPGDTSYFIIDSPRVISGNVAYTTGGDDSPFNFNQKLIAQMNALNVERLPGGWTKTTAPQTGTVSDWTNYASQTQTENGVAYYPYRPNTSSLQTFLPQIGTLGVATLSNLGLGSYDGGVSNARSAGVDCIGFLERVASYRENRYASPDITKDDTWTSGAASNQLLNGGVVEFLSDAYSTPIASATGSWADQPDDLAYLVPGDTIGRADHNHVAIIQSITLPKTGEEVSRFNISVVHATSGDGNTWMVRANDFWQTETLNTLGAPSNIWYVDGYLFEARRLK